MSKACFRERWRLASRDRRREVRMTTSIGAVLRSTGLATIDRALLARAEKPRVKVWAGSIAVGHEKRAKAYTPIRNARQMREMIEAAKLYERQTLAQRRTTRSEEHTSELQSLMRNSYAVFCLKKKTITNTNKQNSHTN